jgi:hypothetical protein
MVVVEKEQQINSNLSSFLGGGLGVGTLFALHPGPYLAIPTATQAQSGSFVVHFVGALQLPGPALGCILHQTNGFSCPSCPAFGIIPSRLTIPNQPALLMFRLQSASGLPITTAT